ncbi:zinc-dependent metalloprotease [uncultured Dokdonia sp.]|uniref:zinc-dependent metalloprotease n=1 Tax=uncultured Dokdonia sp. TaxID=575653 RepID=UPI00260677BA|nr:zinc-dependent metalloprotease [uncultured Dokdonia sp.]
MNRSMRYNTLIKSIGILIFLSFYHAGFGQQSLATDALSLFDVSSNRTVASQYLKTEHDGYILQLDVLKFEKFMRSNVQEFTLLLPAYGKRDQPMEIQLMQSQIINPGALGMTSDGKQVIDLETQGTHYWGRVAGEQTQVAISFFNDEIYGYFSGSKGSFNLIPLKNAGKGIYAFYKDALVSEDLECGMTDAENENVPPYSSQNESSGIRIQRHPITISLEANYPVFLNPAIGNGSVTQTINMMLSHFNQSAMIFANEEITMWVSEAKVESFDTPSGTVFPGPGMTNQVIYNGQIYCEGATSNYMTQFQNERGNTYNGDYAYLFVNSTCFAAGRAATIGGFCDNPNTSRMGVGLIPSVLPTNYELPSVHPRLKIFIHEMGHLFGSSHTRSCIWNGNGTALDAGPNGDANNCYTGPDPAYFTFMSSGGGANDWQDYDYRRGFGVQPGQRIRDRILEHIECFGELTFCQANRYIFHRISDETPVDYNGFYQALNIKADNKIVNNSKAIYVAQHYIELLPGFDVATNSEFNAIIVEDCLNYEDVDANTESGFAPADIPTFSVQVIPNPSNGQFKVYLDKELKQLEYQLLDISGMPLYQETLREKELFDVNYNTLKSGIYLLRIISEGTTVVKKIIIK